MSEELREEKADSHSNGESAPAAQSSSAAQHAPNMPAGVNPISMMSMMPNMFSVMQQSLPMQDSQNAPMNPLAMGMPHMMNPMAFPFNPAAWNGMRFLLLLSV
jgi:hypothetical protein